MEITIRSGETVLASGSDADGTAIKAEGNWYFAPGAVTGARLATTDHTYQCPYKGLCHYVDAILPGGQRVSRVAWVYAEPMTGWEHIKGRYGFYSGEAARKLGKTVVEER